LLILKIEGENNDPAYFIPAERYTLFAKEPTLNWGYKTEPQSHLRGQQIDYSRGKGLGGGTAINFSCWVVGADEDFNEWARLVGDETWSWRNVKERFKKITSHHVNIAEEHKEFVNPAIEGNEYLKV
jgi:choline dehydrogenase-like flavoprotein